VLPSHQDVGRFGGATGSAAAVGLAPMFLPPGYQRDCACAHSLTRAQPGSYRGRIKPSVCATPAPAVSEHTSSQVWGEVCPASRLTIRHRHPEATKGRGRVHRQLGAGGPPPLGVRGSRRATFTFFEHLSSTGLRWLPTAPESGPATPYRRESMRCSTAA
jgi:hypothetical protein